MLAGAFDPPDPADYLLLGEIHDHPLVHRERAVWLDALARRHRFALAFEQFDVHRQPDLDRARASDPALARLRGHPGGPELAAAARRLAEAGGFDFQGWHWPFYAPYLELALRHELPVVAVNLSREQGRRISRGETVAPPPPAGWVDSDDDALAEEIRRGHCGMLPERAIAPMARAQSARDATIARAIVDARHGLGLPVVLLAGNGHVRNDLGVPRHLSALAPGASAVSVGFVESAVSARDADFDVTVQIPAHSRPDPCEGLRK